MFTWRKFLTLLLLLAIPANFALAQTATPSPTPTLTPTPMTTYGTVIPVGAIVAMSGTFSETSGWLLCDGRAVSRTSYAKLFQLWGTFWGVGDGSSTFNLPNCQSRTIMGYGQGSGLSFRDLGVMLGNETHTLTVTEMPSHGHSIVGGGGSISAMINGRPVMGASSSTGNYTGVVNNTGGGAAFDMMNPSLVMYYMIWSGAVPLEIGEVALMDTPTPDGLMVYSTVQYGETSQNVAIRYEVTAGDSLIAILLFLLCGLLILQMFMRARENRP